MVLPSSLHRKSLLSPAIYTLLKITSRRQARSRIRRLNLRTLIAYTTVEQVAHRTGSKCVKADLLPESLTELGMEAYLGERFILLTLDGNLVHLETFGTEGGENIIERIRRFNYEYLGFLEPQPGQCRQRR